MWGRVFLPNAINATFFSVPEMLEVLDQHLWVRELAKG